MNISKNTMEVLVEKMSEDYKDICPRCGGKLTPVDPFPYGGGVSLSRLAHISICPECGTNEAVQDFSHREDIQNNFEKYVAEQLGKWHIVNTLLHGMSEQHFRAIFIECMESNMYEGTNVDGEETQVWLQQGEGMTVKTCHKEKPLWFECVHYDSEGYKEGVSYEYRGKKE